MYNYARRRGFTLMELLVVMVIIGLLVSMLFPVIMLARERTRRTKAQVEVMSLATAWRAYYQTYGVLPSDTAMTPANTAMLGGVVGANNKAGIVFMRFSEDDLGKGFRDPWYWKVKAAERSSHFYQLDLNTSSIGSTKWTFQTRVHCMNHNRGKY
jgi:prepilin-type N-terminal cleavage/methylation domain-containing protein